MSHYVKIFFKLLFPPIVPFYFQFPWNFYLIFLSRFFSTVFNAHLLLIPWNLSNNTAFNCFVHVKTTCLNLLLSFFGPHFLKYKIYLNLIFNIICKLFELLKKKHLYHLQSAKETPLHWECCLFYLLNFSQYLLEFTKPVNLQTWKEYFYFWPSQIYLLWLSLNFNSSMNPL